MASVQISGALIAKRLASCNPTTRNRALRLLSSWLPQQFSAVDSLPDGDLIKIWKGLFYCVWHADKLPSQLDLINRLSSLLETLDPNLSVRYLEAFLITIRREWSGIDFLRLDKFYLLIRKFVDRSFALLNKYSWDYDHLNQFVGILNEKSLVSTDKFQACGVNYHIAEIYLDEMQGFLPMKPDIFDLLLRPFGLVLERSVDRVLVNKIKVSVFERLAENGGKYLDGERSEQVEKFGKFALVLGFSDKFFKSASDSETVQGNRKVLFGLHEMFLKLEKDLEKSGMEISFEESSTGSEVEKVESLVAENVDGDGGLKISLLKKRKRKANSTVKKKKKKNVLSDSVVDSNGKIDDTTNDANDLESNSDADGDNNTGCNDTETKNKRNKTIKKKPLSSLAIESNGEIGDVDIAENANGNLNEPLISGLLIQFDEVAGESGLAMPASPVVDIGVMKKREQVKNTYGDSTMGIVEEKSVKKVKFSMKNNLVWKPQNPLPPQSLRLPPSSTPRGSALKKGVPPGPIRETPPSVKKIRVKGSSVKKGRKILKSVSPKVKRIRKLKSLSA